MKQSKFRGEQIAFELRQAEVGTSVAEVSRKMCISRGDLLPLKAALIRDRPVRFGKIRRPEDENQKLKGIAADLPLDNAMLQELLAKKV